jgi:hypothetical protein
VTAKLAELPMDTSAFGPSVIRRYFFFASEIDFGSTLPSMWETVTKF